MSPPAKKQAPADGDPAEAQKQNQQPYSTMDWGLIRNAVLAVKPVTDDDPQNSAYYTAYELCRELRRQTGSLDYDATLNFAKCEPLLRDYANRYRMDVEALTTEFVIAWPESSGQHRNPFEGATWRYLDCPDRVKISANSPSQNKVATFALALHEEVRGAPFYLPCAKVGEVVGVTKMTASRAFKVLVARGFLSPTDNRESCRESAQEYYLNEDPFTHVTRGMLHACYTENSALNVTRSNVTRQVLDTKSDSTDPAAANVTYELKNSELKNSERSNGACSACGGLNGKFALDFAKITDGRELRECREELIALTLDHCEVEANTENAETVHKCLQVLRGWRAVVVQMELLSPNSAFEWIEHVAALHEARKDGL